MRSLFFCLDNAHCMRTTWLHISGRKVCQNFLQSLSRQSGLYSVKRNRMAVHLPKHPMFSSNLCRELKLSTKDLGIHLSFTFSWHCKSSVQQPIMLLWAVWGHKDRAAVWTALDAGNQSISGVIVLRHSPLTTTPGLFSVFTTLGVVGHFLDSPTRANKPPLPLLLWLSFGASTGRDRVMSACNPFRCRVRSDS